MILDVTPKEDKTRTHKHGIEELLSYCEECCSNWHFDRSIYVDGVGNLYDDGVGNLFNY